MPGPGPGSGWFSSCACPMSIRLHHVHDLKATGKLSIVAARGDMGMLLLGPLTVTRDPLFLPDTENIRHQPATPSFGFPAKGAQCLHGSSRNRGLPAPQAP